MSLSESDQSDESLGLSIDPKKRKCVELYCRRLCYSIYVNRWFRRKEGKNV